MLAGFLDNARALLQNADEAVTKARAVAAQSLPNPRRLLTNANCRNSAKTLRAFQAAMPNVHVRFHDWSNKDILEGDTRLAASTRIDRYPPAKASACRTCDMRNCFTKRVWRSGGLQHPFARRRAIPLAEVCGRTG